MKYDNTYYPDELYHHGVKGMKWGVRRRNNKYSKELYIQTKRYKKNKNLSYAESSKKRKELEDVLKKDKRVKRYIENKNNPKKKLYELEAEQEDIIYKMESSNNKQYRDFVNAERKKNGDNDRSMNSTYYTESYLSNPKASKGDKHADRYREIEKEIKFIKSDSTALELSKELLGKYGDKQYISLNPENNERAYMTVSNILKHM